VHSTSRAQNQEAIKIRRKESETGSDKACFLKKSGQMLILQVVTYPQQVREPRIQNSRQIRPEAMLF
jgi:hypothetical protein